MTGKQKTIVLSEKATDLFEELQRRFDLDERIPAQSDEDIIVTALLIMKSANVAPPNTDVMTVMSMALAVKMIEFDSLK